MDRNCPKCGGPAQSDPCCHTYPGGKRDDGSRMWMACMPCDSATIWTCALDYAYDDDGEDIRDYDEMCGWRWTQGLNPDNPRSADNENNNPRWEE